MRRTLNDQSRCVWAWLAVLNNELPALRLLCMTSVAPKRSALLYRFWVLQLVAASHCDMRLTDIYIPVACVFVLISLTCRYLSGSSRATAKAAPPITETKKTMSDNTKKAVRLILLCNSVLGWIVCVACVMLWVSLSRKSSVWLSA